MLKSLAIGLAVGFTATAALAHPERPEPQGVWDANAQFVGTLIGQTVVLLPNGVAIGADPGGDFFGQDAFYFTSDNCSGTPYLIANALLQEGAVVSGSLFYPAHPAKLALGSWALTTGGGCNKAPQTQWAGAATQASLPKVTPPLCVSPTKIRCQ